MYKLSVHSVKPGMVLYDDVYNERKELLLKSNTELTADKIKMLIAEYVDELTLAEPDELGMTQRCL